MSPDGERDQRGPLLSDDCTCDGFNPMTGRACVREYHRGYHRDSVGAEWLDDE